MGPARVETISTTKGTREHNGDVLILIHWPRAAAGTPGNVRNQGAPRNRGGTMQYARACAWPLAFAPPGACAQVLSRRYVRLCGAAAGCGPARAFPRAALRSRPQ